MESVGATNIFECLIEKYDLSYTSFLGDGDSKSFKFIGNVYGEPKVIKQECIGHYQKRAENRLWKLRNAEKLGGANRLTNKKIDTLQNYFGIARRKNTGDLQAMSDAIMSSLYQVCGYHADCPKPCLYQRDKINGTHLLKSKGSLPVKIRIAILPISNDIIDPEMLKKKCLPGITQNTNECFNGMICERIPKIHYVGPDKMELDVCDAIAYFNYGKGLFAHS